MAQSIPLQHGDIPPALSTFSAALVAVANHGGDEVPAGSPRKGGFQAGEDFRGCGQFGLETCRGVARVYPDLASCLAGSVGVRVEGGDGEEGGVATERDDGEAVVGRVGDWAGGVGGLAGGRFTERAVELGGLGSPPDIDEFVWQ